MVHELSQQLLLLGVGESRLVNAVHNDGSHRVFVGLKLVEPSSNMGAELVQVHFSRPDFSPGPEVLNVSRLSYIIVNVTALVEVGGGQRAQAINSGKKGGLCLCLANYMGQGSMVLE